MSRYACGLPSPSYLDASRCTCGQGRGPQEAEICASHTIITQLLGDYIFYPVAIETLGSWGESASELCRDLGARLARVTGEARSLMFLKQRISVAIQRGNAISVVNTYRVGAPPYTGP